MGIKQFWYAAYGSNLLEDRFLSYINGRRPWGNKGARDTEYLSQTDQCSIPYELYFAKHSKKWKGAVAFLDPQPKETNQTICRLYLVKQQQFIDIWTQENGNNPQTEPIPRSILMIPFESHSFQDIGERWYNRIIFLGFHTDGLPIYTITNSKRFEVKEETFASEDYLVVLVNGFREMGFHDDEIKSYFLTQVGIKEENLMKAFKEDYLEEVKQRLSNKNY